MDKLRISYTQTGRAIWISHLDMMRMLQRAMNRASVPIRYSEGFNPHAQISILLPLSVGTESLCQLADIRVRADVDIATLPQKLTAVMPEGIVVTDCWEDGAKAAEECGLSLDFYANRRREEDEFLPWERMNMGVTKSFLLREKHQAEKGVVSPDCRHACSNCGAAKFLKEGKCNG